MTTPEDVKRYDVRSETRHPQPVAVVVATLDAAEIPAFLGGAFGEVAGVLGLEHLGPAGPPFARYHRLAHGRFAVEAGFPCLSDMEPTGRVQPAVLPGGYVAVTTHVGPYDEMEPGYTALAAWVSTHGGELAGDPWEVYLSDPAEGDPSATVTDVVQPYQPA